MGKGAGSPLRQAMPRLAFRRAGLWTRPLSPSLWPARLWTLHAELNLNESRMPSARAPVDSSPSLAYKARDLETAAREGGMTQINDIVWQNTILPFQLDKSDIRGRIGRLDGVLDPVLRQHSYPGLVEKMVAEALALTALIGQMIKLRWKLSLQIRGNGPVRLIATDYYSPGKDGSPARLRAYASFDSGRIERAAAAPGIEALGKGYFAILIDQGESMETYQGITPIAGDSLSDCAATYFAQSEQLPTRFAIDLDMDARGGEFRRRVGGVMIQHMPRAKPSPEEGTGEGGLLSAQDVVLEDDRENWTRVNSLLDTVGPGEVTSPDFVPTDLLYKVFHEESVRVFDAQPLEFGCTCSLDRVRQSLSIYSAKEIRFMTDDNGKVTADCQFCGAHYELDPSTVGFEAAKGGGGGGKG